VSEPPRLAVVSGFDRTVVVDDLTGLVCDRFAVPSWRRWIETVKRDSMARHEALRMIWSSVRAPLAEVQVFVDDAAVVRAGFSDLLDLCIRHSIPFHVATDAPDVIVCPVMPPRPGAFRLLCSSADFKRDGVRLQFPHRDDRCETCGACPGAIAAVLRDEGYRTVGIGSLATEACLLGKVDLLFAAGELADVAKERNVEFRPFDDFREVRRTLDSLLWTR
jgi:2-hydroxy-3-keto-5-methylthiopentenyl-1-phosphate phosphatase